MTNHQPPPEIAAPAELESPEAAAVAMAADEDRPERLAAALGLTFRNPDLLHLALTHRSVLHDWVAAGAVPMPTASNERLEFLGDAFLGLVVAQHLYERYPDADEGTLTALRVALVRTETIVAWARELRLGDYLYLGQGEKITAGARDRMLAGAFEALLGAIAVDQGLRGAKRFLRPFLMGRDVSLAAPTEETNPKGRLQEVAQERVRLAPDYRLIRTEGPAHARLFSVEVWIGGALRGAGSGPSKRAAEQEAARAALIALAAEDEPGVATIVRNGVCPPGTDAAGEQGQVQDQEQEQAVAAGEGEVVPASGRRSRRRRSDG